MHNGKRENAMPPPHQRGGAAAKVIRCKHVSHENCASVRVSHFLEQRRKIEIGANSLTISQSTLI
jgi:hypothetical protein